ncbi:MAG TPA: STAS/SEC14 domain-containing protein [Polyangiaceae bacterium]|nr:STAS/SEC14 domain-containing protein [Polyangiaceae bacterium]
MLTAAELRAALTRVERDATALLIDATEMTDYERDAREAFVEWSRSRPSIKRIAIVVNNPLWRMVISAMGIASRRDMRAFDNAESAMKWLDDRAR